MWVFKRLHLDDLKPRSELGGDLFERWILDRLAWRATGIREVKDRRLARRVPFQVHPCANQPAHDDPAVQAVREISKDNKCERN